MGACPFMLRLFLAGGLLCSMSVPVLAVEGSSAAGPIGGTDIRSAFLPPPGLYGGLIFVEGAAWRAFDGAGNRVSALDGLRLRSETAGAAFLYVPDFEFWGGRVGVVAVLSGGDDCGHLFADAPKRCIWGAGDPYVEVAWSRFFGTLRPSQYAGAFPIRQGLTIQAAFGAVLPFGEYNVVQANIQGLNIGNNIWDFAPIVAATYTTQPILGEGTEFSARFYWNNYLRNPATQYATGALLDVDFAVTEHSGRWQLGFAGYYATQVADDTINGVRLPPDGHRTTILSIGGVLAYDVAELDMSFKLKALTKIIHDNTVGSYGVAVSAFKKLK